MNRLNSFAPSWGGRFAALAVLGMMFSATNARASCVHLTKSSVTPILPLVKASPSLGQDAIGNPGQPATIVGLWHVIYTANYVSTDSGPLPLPNPADVGNFTFAESLKTWHADGTEWEELIYPPPAGGFCYGVWKHTADGSIKLHHIGVIFVPPGSSAAGTIATIFYDDEINRVSSDGRTYSGTFDFKFYKGADPTVKDSAGADIFGTGPVLEEIRGTTAASRIAVN